MNPARGWLSFAFWSHKICRWICPWAMLTALVSNAVLVLIPQLPSGLMNSLTGSGAWSQRLLQTFLAIQVLGYLSAAVTRRLKLSARWQKPFRLPELFVQTNLALLVGFFRWFKGIRSGTWVRTERTEVTLPGSPMTPKPDAAQHAASELVTSP